MNEVGDEEKKDVKIIIIGNSGVGKTSIIQKFVYDNFDENEVSSNAITFAQTELKFEDYNKTIKFEIWDTVGQERYKSLAKTFYKNSSMAIMVYDITNKDSFEEIKNFWLDEIRQNTVKDISKYHTRIII